MVVVGAMLSWVHLIPPQAGLGQPMLTEITSLAYPVLNLAMLAVAVRLVLGGGRRTTAHFLLLGNLLAVLTADSIYVRQQLSGSYDAGNYLDAVWPAG